MLADVDLDVVAHFGFVRNIDISSKGLYFVRASLLYGPEEQVIAPVSIFSQPSRLDSTVAEQRIPPPPALASSTIETNAHKFCSRVFIIRYKDEKHELNDGVHWRLTLPELDLYSLRGDPSDEKGSSGSKAKSYDVLANEIMFVKFELVCAPLLPAPPGVNALFDVEKLVPDQPEYEVVAMQKLQINFQGTLGFHEYFPVRFDALHCVELDAMVHCGITDIRFRSVSFGVLQEFERRKAKRRQQLRDKINEKEIDESDISINIDAKIEANSDAVPSIPDRAPEPAAVQSRLSFGGFSALTSPTRPRESLLGSVITLSKNPALRNLNDDAELPSKENEDSSSGLDQSFAGVGIWYSQDNLAPCVDDAQEIRVIEDNYFQPPVTPPSVERKSVLNDNFQFAKEEINTEPAILTENDEQYFGFDDDEDAPSNQKATDGLKDGDSQPASAMNSTPKPADGRMPSSRGSYKPSRKSFTPSSPVPFSGATSQPFPNSPVSARRGSRGSFGSHMPPRKLMLDAVPMQTNNPSTPKKMNSLVAPKNQPVTPIPPNYLIDEKGLKPNGPIAARHSIGRATITFPMPMSIQQTSTVVVRTPPGGGYLPNSASNVGANGVHVDNEAIFSYTNAGSSSGVRQISLAGIEKEDLESVSRCYIGPISTNYKHLVSRLQWIRRAAEKFCPEVIHERNVEFSTVIDGMNEETMNSLMMAESISATKAILLVAVNISSLVKCSTVWNNLLATLPKCMPYLLRRMKKRHFKLMTVFWKEQLMVHTCRATNMTKVHQAESEASALLEKLLKIEAEKSENNAPGSAGRDLSSQHPDHSPTDGRASNASASPLYLAPDLTPPMELNNDHQGSSHTSLSHVFLPARGLCLFDPNIHKTISRLPTLVIQQYIPSRVSGFTPLHSSANLASGPKEGVIRGGRLIGVDPVPSAPINRTQSARPVVAQELAPVTPAKKSSSDWASAKMSLQEDFRKEPQSPNPSYLTTPRTPTTTPSKLMNRRATFSNALMRGQLPNQSSILMQTPTAAPPLTSDDVASDAVESLFTSASYDAFYAQSDSDDDCDGINIRSTVSAGTLGVPGGQQGMETADTPVAKKVHVPKAPHYIFLQHGYKGSSYDMRLLKNSIAGMFPDKCQIFCTISNEDKTDDSIDKMGERLALELLKYFQVRDQKMLTQPNYAGRVSFVGHSVGGLIIRKALEFDVLKPLLNKLHLYVSLASPHLGTLYADSQLISTGMWALFKLQKSTLLKELNLDDSSRSEMSKALLYRLSENGVLMHFRWVVFVSSPKDMYVPQYSARVQISAKAIQDATSGPAIVTMAANLIGQVDPTRMFRVSLDNNVGDAVNINTVIGRTAHICYLDNPIIAEQLVHSLYGFFL